MMAQRGQLPLISNSNGDANHHNHRPKDMINIGRGYANSKLLPRDAMKQVMKIILQEEAEHEDDDDDNNKKDDDLFGLQYGYEAGPPIFLKELSAFLHRQCIHDEKPSLSLSTDDQQQLLFATDGVSHGLDLLCCTLCKPGDVVWVERPTYFLIEQIFTSHGCIVESMDINSIFVDDDDNNEQWNKKQGIDQILQSSSNKQKPKLIYIIPTNHNPTGRTLSMKQREKLVTFCEGNDIWLVADEVYHLLDWSSTQQEQQKRKPCRMSLFSSSSSSCKTISVSSFTKIWAPGIRCGWIETSSQDVLDGLIQHGYIQSQRGHATFTAGTLLRVALQHHICDKWLKDVLLVDYKERSELVVHELQQGSNNIMNELKMMDGDDDENIEQQEPIEVVNVPMGGYFLWLRLCIEADIVLEHCCRNQAVGSGVKFLPGHKCFVGEQQQEEQKYYARLCYADSDKVDLVEGARRLVKGMRELILMRRQEENTQNDK